MFSLIPRANERPEANRGPLVIRSTKTRRRLSWLGLFAIALVAIAPTVSRLRAVACIESGSAHDIHAEHHHATSNESQAAPHAHEHDGQSPDDCWSKCGYCDFLAHAPAIDNIDYVAAFVATHTAAWIARAVSLQAYPSYAQAAQPRGPPSFV